MRTTLQPVIVPTAKHAQPLQKHCLLTLAPKLQYGLLIVSKVKRLILSATHPLHR